MEGYTVVDVADKAKKAGENLGLSTISLGTLIGLWVGLSSAGVPLPKIVFDSDLAAAQQATYQRIDNLSDSFTKSACLQAEDKLISLKAEKRQVDEDMIFYVENGQPPPDYLGKRLPELEVGIGKWQRRFEELETTGLCL